MLQPLIHYGLHGLLPLLVAWCLFRSNWKKAYLVMLLGMCIDLDHLLATPLFDPNRCSINFHPLHTYGAMAVYILLAIFRKTRAFGMGLCLHMIADAVDCAMMSG